ncbi:hypothetical protein BJX64DRAFT_206625 [Aspergillus heterothallicus]
MSSLGRSESVSPSELFKYLPEYGVVICTACRYAVQPQAIARHLKEIHRILRSNRRKYNAYVADFCLRQPQDIVPPKDPLYFPVPYLPVEPGFRCNAPKCEYMCVSCKRMEGHWRSDHGTKALPHRDFQPVPLQTFFRGNLLKYFTAPDSTVSGRQQSLIPGVEHLSIKQLVSKDENADLFDHYLRHTAQSFITDAESQHVWRAVVPALAGEQSFLLRGLLACTAHHKAYLTRDNAALKKEYLLRACALQDAALPEFRFAIENPTEDNCHAILVFAYLLVVFSFASSGYEHELLGTSGSSEDEDNSVAIFVAATKETDRLKPNSILPNWLYLLRGGCSMLCDVWDFIQAGPVRSLATAWDIDLEGSAEHDPEIFTCLLSTLVSVSTPSSLGVLENSHAGTWSDEVKATYTRAATQLSRSFAYLHRIYPDTSKITTWDILRVWPMEVSMEYMALLQQGHPAALVLLANYCVLLRYMERHWYFEGKAAMLLEGICRRLGEKWSRSLEWPVSVVLRKL